MDELAIHPAQRAGSCSPGRSVSPGASIFPVSFLHPPCTLRAFRAPLLEQKCQAKPLLCFTPLLLCSTPGPRLWQGSACCPWPDLLPRGRPPHNVPAPAAGNGPAGFPAMGEPPKNCCCRTGSDESAGISNGTEISGEARVWRLQRTWSGCCPPAASALAHTSPAPSPCLCQTWKCRALGSSSRKS